METIPRTLLRMLAQKWKPADPDKREGAAFEHIFAMDDRAADPSFYFAREDSPPLLDMLRFAEVAGLLRDRLLTPTTATIQTNHSGQRIASTNEHAAHAVYDFCQEVYAAFHLQERLAKVEQQTTRTRPSEPPYRPREAPRTAAVQLP
jgi:hypothetical protein